MTPRRVSFSQRAERQLEDLLRYITEDSGEARADAFVGRVVEFCKGLSTFPERGTRRDDLRPGLRTIGFRRRATVAFVVGEEEVTVLGVFYGGQDFEAALDESE